jgi:hypothetical protein
LRFSNIVLGVHPQLERLAVKEVGARDIKHNPDLCDAHDNHEPNGFGD